jgi:hypothetical protein
MSAGKATRNMLQKVMNSRQMAEQIQKTVGADKSLQRVRHGTFAEDGVINTQFLKIGTGANILPQSYAEFDSHALGAYAKGSFIDRNPTIVDINGKKWLQLDGKPDLTQWNYWWTDNRGKTFFKFSDVESRQILSFTARRVNVGKDIWIRQRWVAAEDSDGTNSEVLFTTEWGILTDDFIQDTMFTWGEPHISKHWVRYEMQIWGDTGDGTEQGLFNYFMLEQVLDTKTEPSKYTGPSPREGDISLVQLSSGYGKNLLQYDQATLSPLGDINDYQILVNGVLTTMGDMLNSPVGNGTAHFPTLDNTWRWAYPYVEWHDELRNLKPDTYYLVSCDVDSIYKDQPFEHEHAVQMRVKLAYNTTSVSDVKSTLEKDILTGAGTTYVTAGTSDEEFVGVEVVGSTYRSLGQKKLFVRFKSPDITNYVYMGIRIDVKADEVSSHASITGDRLSGFANFQLEEIDAYTTEPRPYSLPDIGEGQQSLQEQELHPWVYLDMTADQAIGSGNTAQLVFGTKQDRGRGALGIPFSVNSDSRIELRRAGLWVAQVILWAGNPGSSVNWDIWITFNNFIGQQIAKYQIPGFRGNGGVAIGGGVNFATGSNQLHTIRLFALNGGNGPRDLLANTGTEIRGRFQVMYMGN